MTSGEESDEVLEARAIHMGLVLLYTQYMQGRSVFDFDGTALGPMDFKAIIKAEEKYRSLCNDQ